MFTPRTLRFIADHSSPTVIADAFQASVAVAIQTARQWHTFLTEGPKPSYFTVTGEGFGTIAIDACLVVDLTYWCVAMVFWVSPSRQAPYVSLTITVICATLLQIFSHTCKFNSFV